MLTNEELAAIEARANAEPVETWEVDSLNLLIAEVRRLRGGNRP